MTALEISQWEDDGGAIAPEPEVVAFCDAGGCPVSDCVGCRELCEPRPIREGQLVREAAWRVPEGCTPFRARVLAVAPDGWVSVSLGSRSFSFAPHEVEVER